MMKTLLFFLITSAFTGAQAETILLKSDKWCPYICNPIMTQEKRPGYVIELAKIIFEKKGHNVVFQLDNWTNSIESTRFGVATGLAGTSKSDAPDFIYPKVSIGVNRDCFYVKTKDPWEYITAANLKKRKIGLVESYAYSAELMSYFTENADQLVKSRGDSPLADMLKNLEDKKIDTVVENPNVFNFYTESKKIRDHYEEAGCNHSDSLYIGFSPKNPRSKEFAKILSDGILELRKDGTLGKILEKYSLKDWDL